MAVVKWTSSSSGSWTTSSNWAGGNVPGPADDVQIEVANITVTFGSGTLACASLVTEFSTLSMTGGTLSVTGAVDIGGAFAESGSPTATALNLSGTLSTFGSSVSIAGGSLNIDNGLLLAEGSFQDSGGDVLISGNGGTFAGAFSQTAGLIDLAGGQLTAQQGFDQTGGELDLHSTALIYSSLVQESPAFIKQIGGLLTVDGSFAENGGTLDLSGNGVVINGAFTFASGNILESNGGFTSNQAMTMTAGTLLLEGNGAVFYGPTTQTGGTLTLANGALYSYGTFTESGGLMNLGYQGGSFNILTVQSGTIASTAAVLDVTGAFTDTGGTVEFLGRDTILAGPFSQASTGNIIVESGALELEGNGTLAGTISGTGKILVESGTTTIASTAKISLTSIEVAGGTLIFGAGEVLKQSFWLTQQAQLNTDNTNLTLDASSTLQGELVGKTAVYMAGGGVLNGLSLDGTSHLYLTSSVTETGNISFANATGSRTVMDIETSGRLRIAGNFGMTDQSQNGALLIAGSLVKTGGSKTATIDTNVTSTGTIGIDIGTLVFEGPDNSFGGVISGQGTFAIAGGQNYFSSTLTLSALRFELAQGSEQLTLTHSLSYGGEWSQMGGTLWLDGPGVTVTTGGETGLDGGMVTGNGTFSTAAIAPVNASGIDFEGTATLKVAGQVNQTSSVGFGSQIGSAPTLDIASGAVWTIENNASLGGQVNSPNQENAVFVNDGVVQKVNGSGNSYIAGTFDNVGTLAVDNSVLTLNGWGDLAGTLTGNGALLLAGTDNIGTFTLASGLTTSVAVIETISGTVQLGGNLTDAATWAQTGGVVELQGNTLSLSGLVSLEGGAMSGPGTVVASGNVVLGDNYTLSQGTLVIEGHASQVGDLTVGDFTPLQSPPQGGTLPPSLATVEIASGATYYLTDSNNISSNGTLAVAGTFSALGGGASQIGPSVIDTGVIRANAAALRFLGPVSGTGSITIGNGGSLDFAGSVAASTTISFTTGTGSLFLEDTFPNTNVLTFDAQVAGFQSGDFIEFSNLNANPTQISLSLNSTGTVATLADNSGNSDSITFTAAQSLASLVVGIGPHNDITLFHT
jgi:hypothetical protein